MNTYKFKITVNGSTFDAFTQSNNPGCAYEKARRLYPTAEKINLLRLVKQRTKMIIKFVMSLIVFLMIGGIFLLGRIEFDPEEENEAIVNEKKKAA